LKSSSSLPEYPGLGERVLAFGYDYLIIFAYLILLGIATVIGMQFASSEAWSLFFEDPFRADLIAFLVTVLPVSLYFAVSESSSAQATWGKRKRGLILVDTHGNRLSLGRALARSILKFLPWQIAHTSLFNIPGWPLSTGEMPFWVTVGLASMWILVGIYVVTLIVSKQNQTLYDRLSGVQVRFKT